MATVKDSPDDKGNVYVYDNEGKIYLLNQNMKELLTINLMIRDV